MREITSADIARITGGRIVGAADGTETVHGKATVDSRAVSPGDLFIAFEGERADGHDFLDKAHAAGAALSLVTRESAVGTEYPAVLVNDPQAAIDALARHELDTARSSADAPTVIALTGSSGKTSTKDLLASILIPVADTIAPVGSRNNELGLPLTVLEASESTRFMVLEMGARGIGHIAHLTQIARPDVSLVLNVGTAHVGEFGSVDNIAVAKSELVSALDSDGVAVLNADDPRVAAMCENTTARVEYFSASSAQGAPVWASDISLSDSATPQFTLHVGNESRPVTLRLTGEHHVSNALAAASAAHAAGVGLDAIVAGLETATTRSPGRMEVTQVRDGITIINDAYNANPDSMKAALKALAHVGRQRRTIAILGEMLELGDGAVKAHDEIGRLAVRLNISKLLVVGQGARAIHNGASLEGSFGGESDYVENVDEARTVLEKIAEPGDAIMLKSSNGAGLARLGEKLVADWSVNGEERE